MDLNKIISKKLSIAIVTLIMLKQANAPPWCIVIVGIAAITAQCILDYKEKRKDV